jgi:integrase
MLQSAVKRAAKAAGVEKRVSCHTLRHSKNLWEEGDEPIGRGRFRGWAKRAHEQYFQAHHS